MSTRHNTESFEPGYGIIYKIFTTENEVPACYIGSTMCLLATRYAYHLKDLQTNSNKACSSIAILKQPHDKCVLWRDWVDTLDELLQNEQRFLDEEPTHVNPNRAYSGTPEERRKRKKFEETTRYHANKQQIRDRLREKVTCECGKKVARERLTRHRASAAHKLNGPCIARTLTLEQQCDNSCA